MLIRAIEAMMSQAATVFLTLAIWVVAKILEKWHKSMPKIGVLSEKDMKIKVLLAELGVRTKADRAYLSLYKNGEKYVQGSEMFKKTRTHEWVREGVSHEFQNFHDIPISLIPEEGTLVEQEGPSFIYTKDLTDGTFKKMLLNAHVQAIARFAIRRKKGELAYGFIGLDFEQEIPKPPELEFLGFYAARIELILSRWNYA